MFFFCLLFFLSQNVFKKWSFCETFVCCSDLPTLEIENIMTTTNNQNQELVELNGKNVEIEEVNDDQDQVETTNPANKNRYKTRAIYRKIQLFFKRLFKFLICTKRGKAVGISIFLVYLSLSIWSAMQIREGKYFFISDFFHFS